MSDNSSILDALKGVNPADAMPFGAGATPEGSPNALSSMLGGLFGMPKHLVESAQQAVPGLRKADVTDNPHAPEPNQPLYNAAAETTGALAGIGMPAAEAGAAGMFGGALSKTANLQKLEQAMRMTDKGHAEEIIRQLTGWGRGAEGRWMYEIPDERSRMMYLNANGPAATMFQHNELYRAYPQLKDLRTYSEVNPNFPNNTGMWDPHNLTLEMSSKSANEARLGALHELQHAVQHIEGFSPGANVEMFEKMLALPEGKAIANGRDAAKMYLDSTGEVLARNVERRADFDPKMRYDYSPQSTQDTPYANQIRLPAIENHPMIELLRRGTRKVQ